MFRKLVLGSAFLCAFLVSSSLPAAAKTWIVQAAGMTFTPANLTISQGDSVKWVWVNGTHTVTSGPPCTADGMFNAPLDNTHQTFILQFNNPGSVPYFCVFHCSFGMTGTIMIERSSGVDVPVSARTVTLTALPNPFAPSTTLHFSLAQPGHLQLDIIDATGRHVATLANRDFAPGAQEVVWNGRTDAGTPASSGIYFARLTGVASNRAVLVLLR